MLFRSVHAPTGLAAHVRPGTVPHRFLFRHDDKDHIVRVSNRIVIAGLGFLALAMCGCLLLVATYLFGAVVGAITLAVGALPFFVMWFAMPLRRRAQLEKAARSSG